MNERPHLFIPRETPKYEAIREMARRFPELNIDPLVLEAHLTLLRAGHDLTNVGCAYLSSHDLSSGRFFVLMLLLKHEPEGLSPAELAERAGVTRATMTGLLDGLEEAGLCERRQHEGDRRMLTVLLTANGRKRLLKLLPEHYRRMSAVMGHLSEDEKRTLVRLLQKVEAGIQSLPAL